MSSFEVPQILKMWCKIKIRILTVAVIRFLVIHSTYTIDVPSEITFSYVYYVQLRVTRNTYDTFKEVTPERN